MNRLRDVVVAISVACVAPGASLILRGASQEPVLPATVIVKQAAEVAPAVKKGVAPPVDDAAINAQIVQYLPQFRPMFRAEYYFIKNTCGLTKDQRQALARRGERAARAAARQFVEAQQKMMRGGWRPGMESPDPRRLIEDEISKTAAAALTAEQRDRYKKELDFRAASRKQVVIDNLVAKLDQDLVLTSDQRGKLVEALAAGWQDTWGQPLEMLQNIENFFPNVPDQVVTPILTESQKTAWKRIPRNQGAFWGFSFVGMQMEADPLDDPELVEAKKQAEDAEKKVEAVEKKAVAPQSKDR